jgi:hypothetical protein
MILTRLNQRFRWSMIWTLSLGILILTVQANHTNGVQEDQDPPIPPGHFRVHRPETALTTSVYAIEMSIEAPNESKYAFGPQQDDQEEKSKFGAAGTLHSSALNEETGQIRFTLVLNSIGLSGQVLDADDVGSPRRGTFMFNAQASAGYSNSISSFLLQPEKALEDAVEIVVEPGVYPLGEPLELLRYQGDPYRLLVE